MTASGGVASACSAVRPPALEVANLGFSVGRVEIVSGVGFALGEGEFLGMIGPNGAGKTTMLNLLSGLVAASAGSIHLHGRPVHALPAHRRARLGLGRTFQSSDLFPALSVLENVRLAAQARRGGNLRMWRRVGHHGAAVHSALQCLERVGLGNRENACAGLLSHGDKRKLELAILLASEPDVFLLDEPMAGVSAEDVPALTRLIGEVCRERRASVIMVEHHMDVVLSLADRLAVMHHGRLLACDTPEVVMADATVQSAYLGEQP